MKKSPVLSKPLIVFLIFTLLLINFSTSVLAADDSFPDLPLPKWTYITRVAGGVMSDTDSSGRHVVGGVAILLDAKNKVELNATVQSYNGAWYNTSYKWTDTGYGIASVDEPIYLSPGTYRMRLIVKVYSPSNTLLEETTLYTSETFI